MTIFEELMDLQERYDWLKRSEKRLEEDNRALSEYVEHLEKALKAIAVGRIADDFFHGTEDYTLTAGRMCQIARTALAAKDKP